MTMSQHHQYVLPNTPSCILTISGEMLKHERFIFFDAVPVGLNASPFDTLSVFLWKCFTTGSGRVSIDDFPEIDCEAHFRQLIRRLRMPIADAMGRSFAESVIANEDTGFYVLTIPRARIQFLRSCEKIPSKDVSVDWPRLLDLADQYGALR